MVNKLKVGFSKNKDFVGDVDIALFGFGAFSEISFKSELAGKSQTLSDMAKTSKALGAVCFFGVDTDSYGLKRRSVVCSYDGKILGISDSNFKNSDKISVSHGYKIYNTDKGRFGVLVDDICNVDAIKCFSDCECDAIIALSGDFLKFRADFLCQSLSFLYGISICYFCGDTVIMCAPNGELSFYSNEKCASALLSTKRKYTEYTVKTRGEIKK